MVVVGERAMRLLAFAIFLSLVGTASAAGSGSDCGEPGSRWLADFHPQGAGESQWVVLPVNDRLSLHVREEIGFSIMIRDRNTGRNIFGSPQHGVEPLYLAPWEVRAWRSGVATDVEQKISNVVHAGTAEDGLLIVDARELYSSEEDPETRRQDEVFAKGVLHICWKPSGR